MTAVWDAALKSAQDSVQTASEGVLAVHGESFETVMAALKAARDVRTAWASIESDLEREATGIVRENHLDREGEVPGIGGFKVRSGAIRKDWDHHALAVAVADIEIEKASGQADPYELINALLAACAPSYWRVTKLKELEIPIDEYVTTTYGRSTVQFS
jgi:hypothetical protein